MPETSTPKAPKNKEKYLIMHLGVGKARKELYDRLNNLAETLGCHANALVWHAITNVLENPPATAPAGAPARASACGFWVVAERGRDGRATRIFVREVESRGEVDKAQGASFWRYEDGDLKSRNRAKRQAVRAAQQLCEMVGIGIPSDGIECDLLEWDEGGEDDDNGSDE